MFCNNCANIVNENDKFCESCGAQITPSPNARPANVLLQNNRPVQGSMMYYQSVQMPMQKLIGMKWYKFIIYVQLFLAMLLRVGNEFNCLMSCFASDYSMYSPLKVVDIVYGILYIALAAFMFVVRHRLAKFKKNAPSLHIINLIIQIVMNIIWVILVAEILSSFDLTPAASVGNKYITSSWIIVYAVVISIYFKKRQFMFNK